MMLYNGRRIFVKGFNQYRQDRNWHFWALIDISVERFRGNYICLSITLLGFSIEIGRHEISKQSN